MHMRDLRVGDEVGGTGWAVFKSQKPHFTVELVWLLCGFAQSVVERVLSPSTCRRCCSSGCASAAPFRQDFLGKTPQLSLFPSV